MEADAEPERYSRHVSDREVTALRQEVKGHRAYFPCVAIAVPDWKSTDHHVCIAYCLNLEQGESEIY